MAEIVQMSEQDAGSAIDGLLAADPTPAPKAEGEGEYREVKFKAKAKPAKPAPEPVRTDKPLPITAEDGTPDEGAEEDEPPVKAEAKPEPEDSEVDSEDEDTPAPRMLKVKVDGIVEERPEEEVIAGYSRTADYTRKTQALAREKQEFVEQELTPVRAERAHYADVIAQLETAIKSILPETEPDWNALRAQVSPEEFTQAFAEYQGQRQRIEKINAEKARVAALQDDDSKKERNARLIAERGKLLDALPELKDPEKGKGHADDLTAYIVSLGFPEEGIGAVEDHRLFVMAEKARRWDESQRRRPKIEEKIDRALDTIKPSGVRSVPRRSETERAKTRLAETGRFEDAASLISKML